MESTLYLRPETTRAKLTASCAGGLVESKDWPDQVTGRETFEGDVFHSARWDYNGSIKQRDVDQKVSL